MSVRTRLVLTFAVVGVLLIVPAAFAAVGLDDLRDLAIDARGQHAKAARSVGRIENGLTTLNSAVRFTALQRVVGAGGSRDAAQASLDQFDIEVATIDSAGYEGVTEPVRTALGSLRAEVTTIDSLSRARRFEAATDRVETSFVTATEDMRARLNELATVIDERAAADFELAQSIGSAALQTTLVAVLATIIIAMLLSAWTTTALVHPLLRLRNALSRVTEGHFDEPEDLPYSRPDEIGELSKSFGIMSRRLAELDRLRAEFLGVASHELKTPINVIRGYTELIEEELAGELTAHQREIMQRIEEQTRVLTRQVSRLMDISRLETGSFMVEPESVLLADLILGVQRTFEVVAIEKGIRFTTKLEPNAPERVVVDVDLIRDEVINNLVSNALKFTPTGGHVTVRAYGVDDTVIIDVSDTGPGIPPEHRLHIFEKYYQVERSRSMGSGLGLAIAKELVEVHGGTIRLVDSKQGATFRVTLPVGGERITEEARLATAGRSSAA